MLVLIPSGDPPSEIGEPKSISVTIEENEHPYGIIHFPEDQGVLSTGMSVRNDGGFSLMTLSNKLSLVFL